GNLEDYEDYLSQYVDPKREIVSSISGKEISISPMPYCESAKFISDDEAAKYDNNMKKRKLNINDLKDIDSILGSIGEICYSGNIIRGNSMEVHDSDCCFNSSFVYKCTDVYDDKYVAYTCNIRKSEYLFGCNWGGGSHYLIKCSQVFEQTRCFETLHSISVSDCYYVANLESCANCMFSFNQKSKRNMIGNVQLSLEKYEKLREKLVGEIRETLGEKKSVPSIEQVISG
ncbi:MAG: hypothetical protein ABIF01_05245, partial [Candidatus Micrarchaeota archaeon]